MYGDFSAANLAPWAEVERTYSFMMVHQGALVKGKGCSDVLMAADAMELRYENDVIDGYCIVSSDSDFARDRLCAPGVSWRTSRIFRARAHRTPISSVASTAATERRVLA